MHGIRSVEIYFPFASIWWIIRTAGNTGEYATATVHSIGVSKLFCLEWKNKTGINLFQA